MCLPNSDYEAEIYCRTCKRIVTVDTASLVCFAAGHDFEESKDNRGADDLFSPDKRERGKQE